MSCPLFLSGDAKHRASKDRQKETAFERSGASFVTLPPATLLRTRVEELQKSQKFFRAPPSERSHCVATPLEVEPMDWPFGKKGSFRVSRWHGPCRSQADALGRSHKSSRAPFAPWRLLPIADKTHTRAVLVQANPQPKPGQANPSSAKLIQIKMLDFTWFYSSNSGLINGLQRFPNKNFLLAPSPCREAAPRPARLRFWPPPQSRALSDFYKG